MRPQRDQTGTPAGRADAPRSSLRFANDLARAASQRSRLPVRATATPGGSRPAGPRPVPAKSVGSFVPRLTQQVFEKYGFSAATLITDWATIVGADLARYTSPERLKWPRRVDTSGDDAEPVAGRPGATLFLAVEAGRALDIQYKGRLIVDRINAYFGYRAVSDLRIVQVASLARVGAPATTGQTPPARQSPPAELTAVADQDLRAALERMAAGLVSRKLRPAHAG